LPAQHAAFGSGSCSPYTFARDYQRHFGVLRLRLGEKMQKRGVRLALRHAVQIEPDIDRGNAARHALPQAPIKLR
jgi:hypothetical protein